MIALVTGSSRPASNTRRVVALLETIYAELGAAPHVLDLAQLPPEAFLPTAYDNPPAAFAPFARAVLDADGLVVVTPEYNGGMPGVLKHFIDLLEFPKSFDRRPACFIGLAAGAHGALRPVEQLQQIFAYRNAYIYPERVFLPHVHDLLDERGALKDPKLLARLRQQAAGFIRFIEALKGVHLTHRPSSQP